MSPHSPNPPHRTGPELSSPASVPPWPGPARQGFALPLPPLDPVLENALGTPPAISVPAGFAARVAELAVHQPRPAWPRRLPVGSRHSLAPESSALARWRAAGWGPRLTLLSAPVLTAAMFALAPHATPSFGNLQFDAELVLLAQLGGLLLFAPRLLPRS